MNRDKIGIQTCYIHLWLKLFLIDAERSLGAVESSSIRNRAITALLKVTKLVSGGKRNDSHSCCELKTCSMLNIFELKLGHPCSPKMHCISFNCSQSRPSCPVIQQILVTRDLVPPGTLYTLLMIFGLVRHRAL